MSHRPKSRSEELRRYAEADRNLQRRIDGTHRTRHAIRDAVIVFAFVSVALLWIAVNFW